MEKIKKLLMARTCRPEHVDELKLLLPDTEIVCRGYMSASAEDVSGADVIFGNVAPEFLRGSDTVKWVQLASAGADLYAPVCGEGTLLTNATGAYGGNIAEHMLAMLMYLQRNLGGYRENMLRGRWRPLGAAGAVDGSVCLILGMGDIGGSFGKLIKAMGGYVIGVRRTPGEKPDFADEVHTTEALDSLLPRADIVAMALPNTPETAGIMGPERIGLMKPGSYLINVGRGSAVDKAALISALNSERLAGAALDVAEPEPLPENDPLWRAENLLITPHVSGLTRTNMSIADKVQDIFKYNLRIFLTGGEMKNLVDKRTGYRRRG